MNANGKVNASKSNQIKSEGEFVMKTVNYGMNVLNDNGMSASVYNPKHLKSIMQLVRVTLKNGQVFLSLYQPTTIAKIENEKHTFASSMLKDLVIQTEKAKAYEGGKKVFAPKDMVGWIEADQIAYVEVVEIDFDERVLLVAQPQDRLPMDMNSRINVVGFQEFLKMNKQDLEEEYDIVVFSEFASVIARQVDQTRSPLPVVYPFGYAHCLKPVAINKTTLVDVTLDNMDSIATYLEYQVNHKSKRRQIIVHHADIKDMKYNKDGLPFIDKEVLSVGTSESRFLELYPGEGYEVLVMDLSNKKVFADENERELYIRRLYQKGIEITYTTSNEEGKEVTKTERFYFTMRTKSQGRQMKAFFTTCPPEKFMEMRMRTFGFAKEGDMVDIMKIEGRVGLSGSSSIKLPSLYKTTTVADFETTVEPKDAYPLELVQSKETGLYYIPNLKEASRNGFKAISMMHTDGGAFYGHAIGAKVSYEYGEISREEAMYYFQKTCTIKRAKKQFDRDLGIEVTDCVTMDELKVLCDNDKKLAKIFAKIATGIQFRIGEAGKGFAIIHDTKADWDLIVERVNVYNKANNLPQVDWEFDPNMIFLFESSRKAAHPDIVVYQEEFRVCATVSAINHKKAFNKISNQVFMSLNMNKELIDELLDAEVKELRKIFTDLSTALNYAHVKGFEAEVSILTKALSIDPKIARKVMKNKYLQEKELKEVKRRLKELKFGQFTVRAETHYISVDLVGLFHPEKALQAGEACYADHRGVRKGRVGLFRHPLLNAADKASVKLVDNDDRWYVRNILILNCKDATLARMGGADVDGDKVLIIFDKRFLINFKRYYIVQGLKHDKPTKEAYTYENIIDKIASDSDGSNIGGITNTIVRLTDLSQATNFSEVFKDRSLSELVEVVNTYSGLSGEFIDQSGIDESQRLIERDYDYLKNAWQNISYGMNEYLKQRKIDKGYVDEFGEGINEEETKGYKVLEELDTPLTYVCRRVEQLEKEVETWMNYDHSFTKYIADSLPLNQVFKNAVDIINEAKYYWTTRMNTYHTLEDITDVEKELKRQYYDQTVEVVRNIILSSHEDSRVAAAYAFFACYGVNGKNASCPAMPFLTVLDELLDFASKDQRYMYIPFKDDSRMLDGSERVEIIDGALFVNGYYRKRVGYRLASNQLTRIGNDWCIQAVKSSDSRNFIYTAQLPLRLVYKTGKALQLDTTADTYYHIAKVKGKLILKNEAGQTICDIAKKEKFQESYINAKVHIDEVNFRVERENDSERTKQYCNVLVTIVGKSECDIIENPYMEFHPTLKAEKEGRNGIVVTKDEVDFLQETDMVFDDLEDIEYNEGVQDYINDENARTILDLHKEFEFERVNNTFLKEDVVYDDIEEVEEVKPVTTKKHATIVEQEVDEFEYVDFDECYDY